MQQVLGELVQSRLRLLRDLEASERREGVAESLVKEASHREDCIMFAYEARQVVEAAALRYV